MVNIVSKNTKHEFRNSKQIQNLNDQNQKQFWSLEFRTLNIVSYFGFDISNYMKILLVGPQGSGKSTQAKLISQKLDLCMIVIGDMLRKKAEGDDPIAKQIRQDQEKGVLVADETVAEILKEELMEPKCMKGFIIDGWPRTMSQLHLFDPGYDLVFNLVVSEEVSIQRLMKRGRQDDNPLAIQQRLAIYYEQTKQVLDEYKSRGIVKSINGDQSVDQVTAQIAEVLHEKHKKQL
jgi:adenylate kinase